jgi:hypothetical protein
LAIGISKSLLLLPWLAGVRSSRARARFSYRGQEQQQAAIADYQETS